MIGFIYYSWGWSLHSDLCLLVGGSSLDEISCSIYGRSSSAWASSNSLTASWYAFSLFLKELTASWNRLSWAWLFKKIRATNYLSGSSRISWASLMSKSNLNGIWIGSNFASMRSFSFWSCLLASDSWVKWAGYWGLDCMDNIYLVAFLLLPIVGVMRPPLTSGSCSAPDWKMDPLAFNATRS